MVVRSGRFSVCGNGVAASVTVRSPPLASIMAVSVLAKDGTRQEASNAEKQQVRPKA